MAGELVQRAGDAVLALPRGRDAGEAIVDRGGGPQRPDGLGQGGIGCRQLGGGEPLAFVQAGVGQRDTGLMGEHLQQEPLAGRRVRRRADDQEAQLVIEPSERERPAPPAAIDGHRATQLARLCQLPRQVGLQGPGGCARRGQPLAAGQGGAFGPEMPE